MKNSSVFPKWEELLFFGNRVIANNKAFCNIELYLHKKLRTWQETGKNHFTRT